MKKAGRSVLIAVVGSTGTGKTRLGVELARALGGEVVNSDAVQLYAGLPIATAAATPAEQQGVPHHLLGAVAADRALDGAREVGTAAPLCSSGRA